MIKSIGSANFYIYISYSTRKIFYSLKVVQFSTKSRSSNLIQLEVAKGVAATFTRENVALFFLSVAFSRTRVRRQWRFPRSQEYEQYRGWQQISRLQCDHGLYLLIALSFFSLSLSWKEEKQFHRRVFDTLFDHISSLSRYNFRQPTRDNNFNLITNTTFQVNNSR